MMFGMSLLKAQPVADFTANKISGCSPLSVQFTDNSAGAPTSWSWSFGNSNSSSLQNPSAVYVVPGTYTVALTVSNASGTNTKTKVAYITVFTSPIANFNTSVTGGCMPLNVPFTDASTPGSAAITNWLWDFGDGSIGNTQSPSHAYITAGNKNVSLTVTDANGCLNTTIKNNIVNVTQSHTVDFTVSNPVVCNPPSNHIATSTVNPASSGYVYSWQSGGGASANTANFSFTNANTGATWVSVKVTAPSGCEAYMTKYNAVYAVAIKADFDVPNTGLLCNSAALTFLNKTLPDTAAVTYQWYVDGAPVANTKDLLATLAVGNHTVKLVSNMNGCLDSVSKTVTVNPAPTALFNVAPNTICKVPTTIQFTSTSTGSGLTYMWDFGNGNFSSKISDTSTYSQMQNHTIKLLVTNNVGCKDSVLFYLNPSVVNATIVARNQKRGCAPLNTNFTVGNAALFNQFTWIYKGDTINKTSSFNYTFADTGRHVVRLLASDANGCSSEVYDTLWVGRKLPFDFISDKNNGCYSNINPIQLTALENSGYWNVEYLWNWKNGSATGKNPVINLPDTGLYDVALTVVYNGCDTTLIKPHFVTVNPARALVAPVAVGCGVDSVFLDASPSYGKNNYLWQMGDGQTSTQATLYHKYATYGNYSISLLVTDTSTLCTDTFRTSLQIASPPNINFVVNDSLGCTPLKVRVHNTTILDSNAFPIASTNWLFGTGEQAFGNDTSVLVYGYGFHGLTMTMTDTKGCVFTLFKDSVVRVSGIDMKFRITPDAGCIPLPVYGKDSSVLDFGFRSRTWYWPNGDSTYSTDVNNDTAAFIIQTPTLSQKDGFNLPLKIVDTLGCVFKQEKNVVATQPRLLFSVNTTPMCGYEKLDFIADTSSFSVYSPAIYLWKYDGITYTGINHTKNFYQTDTTVVYTFEVTDANGCKLSKDTSVKINNRRPALGFWAANNDRACYLPISPVTLVDTSIMGSHPVKSRFWRLGINTSTLVSPSFILSLPGKYDATLILTDSIGCVDSLTVKDYINLGGPIGSYQLAPKKGCTPLAVDFDVQSTNAMYRIWDFGNGLVDTVTTNPFTYTYTDAGSSLPRLTLVDSSGFCAFVFDATDTVVVFPKPNVSFTIDKTFICYNTQVTFDNTSPSKASINNWKWKVGSLDSFAVAGPLTYTFTSAGNFGATLIGVDTNGCADTLSRDSVVEVFADNIAPAVPKSIYATVLDDSHVEFKFTSNQERDFIKYVVMYNYFGNTPANSTTYFNKTDTIFTQDNIDTKNNPYSYSVVAIDVCNNVSDSAIVHTTVDVTAKGLTNAVQVKWTNYKGFAAIKAYEIWRNNPDSGTTFTKIASVSSGTTTYVDLDAKCFTNYLYKIKTLDAINIDVFSWSDTSGATPVYLTNLTGTENFRATVVDNNSVLVQWLKRDADLNFEYQVYRKRDDEVDYVNVAHVTDTFFIDMNADVHQHAYSYVIYLKDECGGLSLASNEAKTILLKLDLVKNSQLSFDPFLTFNPYLKWTNGVSGYDVYFYVDSLKSSTKISTLNSTDTFYTHQFNYTEQRTYCYQVLGFENGGNQAISESNKACVETKPKMFAPSAFTINDDGINERFIIRGVFIDTFHLLIYDRWGRMVFETTDLQKGWDGTIEGKPAPAGVYVYVAEGTGRSGQPETLNGSVTLIR